MGRSIREVAFASVACGAVAAAWLAAGASARAADETERALSHGSADPVVIREHAGWDRNCAPIAHPALYLDQPPRHGSVCARIAVIRIRSMTAGTQAQCIGHKVRGVQLVYRPAAGYAGGDAMRYAAQYPSLRKTVAVSIAVEPREATGSDAVASSMIARAPMLRQPPGLVPDCAPLSF
jgi:hypothetical protein